MALKTAEIKKFLEMWTPIMETIPAVLDLADQQSQAQRELALAKQALADVEASIDEKTQAAKNNLDSLERLAAEANASWQAALVKAEEARESHKQALKDAETLESKKLKDLQARTADESAKLVALEQDVAAKIAAITAQTDALIADKQAELESVEKRIASAQKTLDQLRAKLG